MLAIQTAFKLAYECHIHRYFIKCSRLNVGQSMDNVSKISHCTDFIRFDSIREYSKLMNCACRLHIELMPKVHLYEFLFSSQLKKKLYLWNGKLWARITTSLPHRRSANVIELVCMKLINCWIHETFPKICNSRGYLK